MIFDELEASLTMMMNAFRVGYKLDRIIKSISVQFVVHQFGLVVIGFIASEYKIILDSVNQKYPDYRKIFISNEDNLLEKKDEVLWALSQGGYLKWLRSKYSRDFKNLVVMQEFGRKIIEQRLRIWNKSMKYNYLIEYNESALRQPATYMLSIDPSFYDFMPE